VRVSGGADPTDPTGRQATGRSPLVGLIQQCTKFRCPNGVTGLGGAHGTPGEGQEGRPFGTVEALVVASGRESDCILCHVHGWPSLGVGPSDLRRQSKLRLPPAGRCEGAPSHNAPGDVTMASVMDGVGF
jgi:hypothetical protein